MPQLERCLKLRVWSDGFLNLQDLEGSCCEATAMDQNGGPLVFSHPDGHVIHEHLLFLWTIIDFDQS